MLFDAGAQQAETSFRKMSSSPGTSATTPTKQVNSWMDEVLRTSSNGSGKKNYSNLLEMERFASALDTVEDPDIPMLPDADELQESLFYNESPNLPSVTTYKQLSSDIFPNGKSTLGNLDEIDISVLTECLENEDDIEEPDEPWVWDQLFTQLSIKISTEAKANVVEFKN